MPKSARNTHFDRDGMLQPSRSNSTLSNPDMGNTSRSSDIIVVGGTGFITSENKMARQKEGGPKSYQPYDENQFCTSFASKNDKPFLSENPEMGSENEILRSECSEYNIFADKTNLS